MTERIRGRRYRSLESIRRGLSAVVNGVELGTMETRKAAIMIQGLQAILATYTTQQIEEQREAAVLASVANEDEEDIGVA